jgi:endoglucanase
MKKSILFLLLICVAFSKVKATDLIDAKPISDRIIELTFIDGQILYHGINSSRVDDIVTLFPGGRMTVANSKLTNFYRIISCDDPLYPITPLRRAANVGANVRVEQTWALDIFNRPTHIEEFHVYLFLSSPMVENSRYNITVTNAEVNNNKKSFTFKFNSKTSRTETIHVNNLGYVPSAPLKYAYVYTWMGDAGGLDFTNPNHITQVANRPFRILKASDRSQVFQGTIAFRKPKNQAEFGQSGSIDNNFLGADVYECDFSSFNIPGEYVISVDGIGCSFPFAINNNIYEAPFFWTMKNIYENRSGIALSTPSAQYNRPICHKNGVNGFKLEYSSTRYLDINGGDADSGDNPAIEAGIKGPVDAWGWYQDAGDWDAYTWHWKVPAYLMHLYELNPAKFKSFNLNIGAESSNALPDLLDEARWLIRFFKRSKDAIKTPSLGGTGGVPGGRIFGDNWASTAGDPEDAKGSWQDTNRRWVMLGEDPWMTFQYAGLAAGFAYNLQNNSLTDPEAIDWKQEALDAYNWAIANSKPGDEKTKFGMRLAHKRMYAAAQLYRLTGDKAKYEATIIYDIDHIPTGDNNGMFENYPTDWLFSSNDDEFCIAIQAYYNATLVQTNANMAFKARVYNLLESGGNYLLNPSTFPQTLQNRATRWGGAWYLPMGIGHSTSPYLNLGITAHKAVLANNPTDGAEWLKYMYTTADYFLGTNPLNTTMVSNIGDKNVKQFFFMDAFYSSPNSRSGALPKKGFVPYGTMENCNADLNGCQGYYGPYKYYYGANKLYPVDALRPGHERFIPSRTSPIGNENTIHQTAISSIMTYGYLYSLTGSGIATGLTNAVDPSDTNTVGRSLASCVNIALSLEDDANKALLNEPKNTNTGKNKNIEILVGPNPVTNQLTISESKYDKIYKIELVEMTGKVILSQNYAPTIELSNLQKGVYILKLHLKSRIKSVKIIKN